MHGYVLIRTDQGGGYVARPGSKSSYTLKLQQACVYPTKEAAELDSCPENEIAVSVESQLSGAS